MSSPPSCHGGGSPAAGTPAPSCKGIHTFKIFALQYLNHCTYVFHTPNTVYKVTNLVNENFPLTHLAASGPLLLSQERSTSQISVNGRLFPTRWVTDRVRESPQNAPKSGVTFLSSSSEKKSTPGILGGLSCLLLCTTASVVEAAAGSSSLEESPPGGAICNKMGLNMANSIVQLTLMYTQHFLRCC